ncbi:hypothetical protein ABZ912_05450 [Nonomuraea angiospora]|uniref:hypothetical protein n=1 Tax=Nonomuraea angiospora TaxID=46172 RepID=UPI00340AED40
MDRALIVHRRCGETSDSWVLSVMQLIQQEWFRAAEIGDHRIRSLQSKVSDPRRLVIFEVEPGVPHSDVIRTQEFTPEQMAILDEAPQLRHDFMVYLVSHGQRSAFVRGEDIDASWDAFLSDRAGLLPRAAEQHAVPKPASAIAAWAGRAAVEPVREEEWRRSLIEIATYGTRVEVMRFAAGILYAGLNSRANWMARTVVDRMIARLCWILRSQARTWTPLLALLFWGGYETAVDTGLGAAVVFVILSGVGFFGLVEWVRKRWNVQVGRRPEKPQE